MHDTFGLKVRLPLGKDLLHGLGLEAQSGHDGLFLRDELFVGSLHLGRGGGVHRDVLHNGVLAILAHDGIGVVDAFLCAVGPVAAHCHAGPLSVGSQNPVSHVFDGSVGSTGARRCATSLSRG